MAEAAPKDDKKKASIVIKKKKAGHGAGHGGAWKVAYADFVTAMMCFFLVLWLIGSDEEIREAVAQYFNNPTSAYRPDLSTPKNIPLGEKTGAGDDLLHGAQGTIPEDLIQRPIAPFVVDKEEIKQEERDVADLLEGHDKVPDMDVDLLHLSIAESKLFHPGTDRLKAEAVPYLERIGKLMKEHTGSIWIKSEVMGTPSAQKDLQDEPYELAISQTVSLKKYLVDHNITDDEHVFPQVSRIAKAEPEIVGSRKFEFVIKRDEGP